ncbi:MAG: hypothetical protein SAJ12_04460 [Jaaginema sp. PMC 1079.18]|nr:hypothetical protein [Jaaginema sp. PMC 1080.18]MEC4850243.1 hypothetical protein [Jaaginema sp. PMC 1079.18]MEC4867293.1 hypothetical protein [Jaaginema sp. PMC 1078.18]
MKNRLTMLAVTVVVSGTFMGVPLSAVMAESTQGTAETTLISQRPNGALLQNINISQVPAQAVETGESVEGLQKLTITSFSVQNGNLLASGSITGVTSDGQEFTQAFSNIPADLTSSSGKQVSKQSCDVLFLDLGPIFLDVLGLTVDLSQITLDINAVSGSGNLLGNLLCQVVSLLDSSALGAALTNLINQINSILGG